MKENNEKKYLAFTSTDGNKKILRKFAKLWDKIKLLIETITRWWISFTSFLDEFLYEV